MHRLPLLLSIPHGGTIIPDEVKDRLIAGPHDLFDDSDPFTGEIYDIGDRVAYVVKAKVYRAVIDLNRSIDMLPPEFPDGVVKSHTCYGKPIYRPGLEPDEPFAKILLNKYYWPYHNQVEKLVNRPGLCIGLDCHSMAAVAPTISPDQGQARPLICLGNAEGRSCNEKTVEILADCFRYHFNLYYGDVKINQPFKGGYITRRYGMKPLPWIQIELNRSLYLNEEWFDRSSLKIDKQRLVYLNRSFLNVLERFCTEMNWEPYETE